MRTLFVALSVLCLVGPAATQEPVEGRRKDDDRERAAKAALALAGTASHKCSCEKCDCPAGRCAAGRTEPTWAAACTKALADRAAPVPVVVFVSCEVRCCGDAVPVRLTAAEMRLDRPAVVVYANGPDGWFKAGELKDTAGTNEIKRVVADAKKKAAEKK